eukprot:CAMPEP_0175898100 /NCGR_PEP_ID=MMETSP0108-20121206/1074_1 /TAXON_ID=195067 ORGANISM="Goniomonas pacifica, Strain CCMP1869" /NCGR_SAMPLE_ID=MMETSP0108 /ASSEMBLY_ACC=CAM_ASM_000204 /LENGTH=113 /DNA_ID=CAMNT_0017219445 /DNA_START=43 /DNA_END=385 /DNA_ORIENTATION=+
MARCGSRWLEGERVAEGELLDTHRDVDEDLPPPATLQHRCSLTSDTRLVLPRYDQTLLDLKTRSVFPPYILLHHDVRHLLSEVLEDAVADYLLYLLVGVISVTISSGIDHSSG